MRGSLKIFDAINKKKLRYNSYIWDKCIASNWFLLHFCQINAKFSFSTQLFFLTIYWLVRITCLQHVTQEIISAFENDIWYENIFSTPLLKDNLDTYQKRKPNTVKLRHTTNILVILSNKMFCFIREMNVISQKQLS